MYTGVLCVLVVVVSLPDACVSVTQLKATPKDTYFFSPSYPVKYGDNLEESWLLVASDPSHVIHMEVVDSQIEDSASCLFDFVQVHDGENASAPVIGKFCGISTPSYVTSGASMYVLFKTDSSGSHIGFYIKYFSSPPTITTTTSPTTTQECMTTTTTTAPPDSTTLGESRLGASTVAMSTTSIIGILVAVAFCIAVVIIIIGSVYMHNSNKAKIEPRKRPNEGDVWKKICSTPTPRRPILKHESDLSSRSTISTTDRLSTSMTSGFSSGTSSSPRQKSVSFRLNQDDYVIHNLAPVPESGLTCYDDVDGKNLNNPQSHYAHLGMMELSPRRLQPIHIPEAKHATTLTSYASERMNQLPKVKFTDETSESDVMSPRGRNRSTGLPNALKKAREARRARNKNRVKSVEESERGRVFAKTSVSRIDLVRCGMLGGERTGVPRVPKYDVRRNVDYPVYDVINESDD
ncbi:uncharacterized protein [Haliotis cracherodii]|uniref:uncharacterized protein n=1 Tax=Haliotis cracherodii TaxID=6455 RepID=UPI0039ED83B0